VLEGGRNHGPPVRRTQPEQGMQDRPRALVEGLRVQGIANGSANLSANRRPAFT
jgi:hypothetical protein